jgi:hypothetical protein
MTLAFRSGRADCRQIEALLPPFVDGDAVEHDAARVRAHLERCGVCRGACEAQRAIRQLLRGRRDALCAAAPEGLDFGVRSLAGGRSSRSGLSVTGRLSALAAAAALVLALASALVWGTGRSSVLLATQLTLDHIKCFMIDGDDHGGHTSAAEAEVRMREQYGLTVRVPETSARDDVSLVAVRRCLSAEGVLAHVLYRYRGEPVSLFIVPGRDTAAADVDAFGRHAQVLVRGDMTYVIVAPARLSGVAAAIGLEAE